REGGSQGNRRRTLNRRRYWTGEGTVRPATPVNPESPPSCRCGTRRTTIPRSLFRTLARRRRRARLRAREIVVKAHAAGAGSTSSAAACSDT
ncbi:unnamed protein product, partial [Ectocarpus sp. 12 AP-2014]